MATRRQHARAAAVIGLALLTACKHFEPAPLVPAKSAAALEGRRLTDAGLRAFIERQRGRGAGPWPPARWDLPSLTLAAIYFRPDLEAARAELETARAHVESAGARPNPTISFSPEYVTNAASGVSPWIGAVHFDWPIETAGKRGHRIAEAERQAEAARLRLYTEAWRLRAELRTSLVDLAGARARVEGLDRLAAAESALVDRMERRAALGAIAETEVAPRRIDRARTLADLAAARRDRLEARARLAAAVGVPAAALEGVDIDFPLEAAPGGNALDAKALRRQALLGRPDVLAALADYAASQAALQLEIAKQYPDLHISNGGYQFDQGANKWALGVSLELPVLDRNQGPIAEAEARRREAAARFRVVQAGAVARVDEALAARAGARDQLARVRALAAAERARLGRVDRALAAGAADRVARLDAEVELERGELALLDARLGLLRALGDLEQAVQRPLAFLDAVAPASAAARAGGKP